MSIRQTIVIGTALFGLAAMPGAARAEGFLIPYVGTNFAGDAASGTLNLGVALGSVDTFGFEFEFGYAPDFQDSDDGVETNVTTMMLNLLIRPNVGRVRPYVAGGAGLLRVNASSPAGVFSDVTENDFGLDLGGGITGMLSRSVGLRGDLRYFRRLTSGDDGLGLGDLSFARASLGLVLSW